jgi:hypothetical protein
VKAISSGRMAQPAPAAPAPPQPQADAVTVDTAEQACRVRWRV